MASDPGVVIFQAVGPDDCAQDVQMNNAHEVGVADATLRDLLYTLLLEVRAMHITLAEGLSVNRTETKDAVE